MWPHTISLTTFSWLRKYGQRGKSFYRKLASWRRKNSNKKAIPKVVISWMCLGIYQDGCHSSFRTLSSADGQVFPHNKIANIRLSSVVSLWKTSAYHTASQCLLGRVWRFWRVLWQKIKATGQSISCPTNLIDHGINDIMTPYMSH